MNFELFFTSAAVVPPLPQEERAAYAVAWEAPADLGPSKTDPQGLVPGSSGRVYAQIGCVEREARSRGNAAMVALCESADMGVPGAADRLRRLVEARGGEPRNPKAEHAAELDAERADEITGRAAIEMAERSGAQLRAHADPTGAADRDVEMGEAEEIAAEDPALVYVRTEYGQPERVDIEHGRVVVLYADRYYDCGPAPLGLDPRDVDTGAAWLRPDGHLLLERVREHSYAGRAASITRRDIDLGLAPAELLAAASPCL